MLQELAIKNFAIIDDLRIHFAEGLTILSGETGAGKSIIINAVNLLLGSRATAKMIRTGEDTAEVEALFLLQADSPTARKLAEQGYTATKELLVKRIISAGNRHKVYINGSLATMQALQQITTNLASISGQHAHQHLLKEDSHLLILDRFAGLDPLRREVEDAFGRLLPLLKERDRLQALQQRRQDQMDLLTFQKTEIESAAPAPGEDSRLENEKKRLKNANELYSLVHHCLEGLYDAQGSVIEQLATVRKSLEDAGRLDENLEARLQTATDLEARLEDLVADLRHYRDTVHLDEGRLDEVEERLDLLVRLKKKYGPTIEEVLARLHAIEAELAGLENIGGEIEKTEAAIADCHAGLSRSARKLSRQRQQAAQTFSQRLEAELDRLKMEGTRFDIVFSSTPADDRTDPFLTVDGRQVQETGLDRVVFHIAPNPGEALKPLAAIASGGELSRVILALKALLADRESVETVVFDEVDAGIGGETAEIVGKKLQELAACHQLVCITHLAQIAKFGRHHYKIEKQVEAGRTTTRITPLAAQERIREIARMSGGEEITATTLAHAEEMLQKAGALNTG